MKRRSFFAGLFAGAVTGAVGTAASGAVLRPAQAQTGHIEVFGVVRFPSTGPQILDDAGHTPKGLTGVSIASNGALVINHTDLVEVGYSSVSSDETLIARGIVAGNSQGFDKVAVVFRDLDDGITLNLNNSSHYNRLGGTSANIWFYARSTS